MAKKPEYKQLTPVLMKEISDYIISTLREEEESLVQNRYDRKRANIKLLLRNYRDIVKYVDKAAYEASELDDDLTLQDILELMGGSRRESFRVESIRENVATARIIVDHMDRMLEVYRLSCEASDKEEDRRRYRVLCAMYIDEAKKTPEEIAQEEIVDKRTVYRDIDAAAETLAVLFFGLNGLRFL